MRSWILAAALGLGSLGLIGATPSHAHASWLSEALHARYGPVYYDDGYYAPAYPSYNYYPAPYHGPGVYHYGWSQPSRHSHVHVNHGYHHGATHGGHQHHR
jgi:hypothetical protein